VRRAYFVAYSGAPPVNGTGWAIIPWADLGLFLIRVIYFVQVPIEIIKVNNAFFYLVSAFIIKMLLAGK
jgi:hypothetical protein